MKIRVSPRPTAPTTATPSEPLTVGPARVKIRTRNLRILDFDVEARPLHWISGDYVSKEITAMAWKWIGEDSPAECYLLGVDDPVVMLRAFLAAYDRADLVTGHFIRGYDLPMVNGALTEYQLPALSDKMAQDTKIDLVRKAGLSSSQENLGATLRLDHPKVKMDQASWRSANRLEPAGLLAVKERVIGDVQQHIELRERLLQLGYLGPARMWYSRSAIPSEPYSP